MFEESFSKTFKPVDLRGEELWRCESHNDAQEANATSNAKQAIVAQNLVHDIYLDRMAKFS